MKFTVPELAVILDQLQRRLDAGLKRTATDAPEDKSLHGLMKWRREHYHNLAAADPVLPKPYHESLKYQSDILRRTHVANKARVTENAFIVRCVPPKETEAWKRTADDAESVWNIGLDQVQERLGLDIMGRLSDGQDIDAFGVLHWYDDHNLANGESAYRTSDEEQEGYEKSEDEDGYQESAETYLERRKVEWARAGLPIYCEVIDPMTFYFVPDKSLENGFGLCAVIRDVPYLDYQTGLMSDGIKLSLNDADKKIRIYQEQDAPADWMTSNPDNWGKTVTVACVWTRDEYYELARGTGGHDWEQVKAFAHYFKMPPFAMAVANENGSPDPALNYEPTMEGLYRLKPFYDRAMTFYMVLAEMVALPYYYVQLSDGSYAMGGDGQRVVLSRTTLLQFQLPNGATLVKVEYEINEAVIRGLEYLRQELMDASPATGRAEISVSTQPWTARIQQAQESLEPARLAKSIGRAIRTMVRSLVVGWQAADNPEPVHVMMDGKPVGIDIEQWRDLIIEVDIDPHSAAERVTIAEHQATILERGLPFTERKFVEEGLGEANATEFLAAWKAEQIFKNHVEPGLIAQILKEEFGDMISIGPDGQLVGFGGQAVPPSEVLARNGLTPVPSPASGGMNGANGLGTGGPLQAPNTLPIATGPMG